MPKACRTGPGCRVHVVFHGCNQQRGKAGDAFVKDRGFADWADANRLIVLFPQVTSQQRTVNPQGCWDWWGYTGRDYLTRKGPQIVGRRRMLDRLASRGRRTEAQPARSCTLARAAPLVAPSATTARVPTGGCPRRSLPASRNQSARKSSSARMRGSTCLALG